MADQYDNFEEDMQAVGRQLHKLKKWQLKRWCEEVGVPKGRTKKDMVENLIRNVKRWELRVEYNEIRHTVEVQFSLGYGG